MAGKKFIGEIMRIARMWAMPNKLTFSINGVTEFLNKHITKGKWLNPFANNSKIGITNDLNPEFNCDYNLDFMDFFKLHSKCDGVLLDPPYSPTQIMQSYKGIGIKGSAIQGGFYSRSWNEIIRLQAKKVIQFGWHTNGRSKLYNLDEILIIAHGGQHFDTLVSVWNKKPSIHDFL